ncbi:diguanylate cyclase [Ectothiorhodospiraceae bacterium WFHF3C12]|nr:diguanylate cyclase [Ectothiorhodospiraceae bacterium WFHF3C12]
MPTDNPLPVSLIDGLFEAALLVGSPREAFAPTFVRANEPFKSVTGLADTELAGLPLTSLPRLGPGSPLHTALEAAWHGDEVREGPFADTATGGPHPTRFRVQPLAAPGEERLFLVTLQSAPGGQPDSHATPPGHPDLTTTADAGAEPVEVVRTVLQSVQAVTGADEAALVENRPGEGRVVTHAVGEAGFRQESESSRNPAPLNMPSTLEQPLEQDGEVVGALQVGSARKDAFGEADRRVLRLASMLLSRCLSMARRADAQLARHRQLIDAVPVLISYVDTERRYVDVNATYTAWFQDDASEIRGRYLWDVLGEEAYTRIHDYVDDALSGNRVTFDAVVPYRGIPRHVEADYVPHFGRDKAVLGFFAVVRDIEDRRRADFDQLTNARSRSSLEANWRELHERASGQGRELSLILIDIDHFKSVNDRLGHNVGDRVLKEVAELIGQHLRSTDVFGRWGGEEFMILCPDNAETDAMHLAERLCDIIAGHGFDHAGRVTASFGVAQLQPGETRQELFRRADGALYDAKANGRNRVEFASDSGA